MTSGALTVRPSGLRRAPALQIGRRRRRRRTVLMRGGARSARMERRAKRGRRMAGKFWEVRAALVLLENSTN